MKNFIFGLIVGIICGVCFNTTNDESEKIDTNLNAVSALASIETPTEESVSEIEEDVSDTHEQSEEKFYGRCMATTKRGTQCKRNAARGSHYCWQHQ